MPTRNIAIGVFLVGVTLSFPAAAEEDVLQRALQDELARSMAELQLENLDRPYFIAYRARETRSQSASATFGSLLGSNEWHGRSLTVEVRVGSYELDNTNFFSFSFGRSGVMSVFGGTVPLPLEDNYDELRRQIWLATDAVYKKALEDLAKKRAVLQNKTRTEEIPDFSVQASFTGEGSPSPVEVDLAWAETLVRTLSGQFREMPGIHTSKVSLNVGQAITYYVNSEGTSYVKDTPSLSLVATAGTQAVDGMILDDFVAVHGRSQTDLPAEENLATRVTDMGRRLQDLSKAPLLERFAGPVLFEGQAAAELFAQGFVPHFISTRRSLSDNPQFDRFNPQKENLFLDKIGIRVLPEFLSVVDDPTASKVDKQSLLGTYEVDDEGVPARKTPLVDKGVLQTLLTTRNPVRGILQSNGHRRGGAVAPSNFYVTAKKGLSEKKMRKELYKLVKRQKKEFGIVVRRLGNPAYKISQDQFFGPPSQEGPTVDNVLLAYKVYPDGREELIRNADLAGIGPYSFKDIIAVSKDQIVYHTSFTPQRSPFGGGGGRDGNPMISLIVPSQVLLEDAILKQPSGEIPRLPVAQHPFFGE